MTFEQCLLEQIRNHPAVSPQDIIKLCYQAAYGAEHLLSDPEGARRYLGQEYEETPAVDLPLWEPISEEVCRINLAGWKREGLPLEWLFRMFALSCSEKAGDETALNGYLARAGAVLPEAGVDFSRQAWNHALAEYRKAGMPALHHSEVYREKEHPAYRIVNARLLRLLPILRVVAERKEIGSDEKPVFVLAIDGRAASGKSTMAEQLGQILDAGLVHMDDFFLPLGMRTEERLATPGGNVHYERFREEVLPHLARPEAFAYRKFECSIKDFQGVRQVEDRPIRIVEGSYSHHPELGHYADLTVFSDVNPEEQLRRVYHRNGPEWGEIFRKKWIPLEEAYFAACRIPENADLRV